jgi:molecular chaperone DnaK
MYSDREIEPYLARLSIPTSRANTGEVLVHPWQKTYSLPQVCAPIIYSLRQIAESFLKQPVEEVVLTAPVSFSKTRCQSLKIAARLAGIKTSIIVDEPTAAAAAHYFDQNCRDLIAVYDFGGGTFDFSILDVKSSDMQVIATAGDTWLGGDDFDEAIAKEASNQFWHQHKIELQHQQAEWQRLMIASERAKRVLSAHQDTVVEVEKVASSRDGGIDLRYHLSRQRFSELCTEIIQRSIDTCEEAMSLCQVRPDDLNAIYLSGGTAYIPAVREAVEAYFGRPGRVAIPPERAVVIGAALLHSRISSAKLDNSSGGFGL